MKKGLILLLSIFLISCKKDKSAIFPEQWEPMPLVTQNVLDKGFIGGEGGQVPQGLAIDPVNGSFLLFGTDVGGIARSVDGGKTWEPANMGYTPRGNSGFAIDPNNVNRALAVGSNTINIPQNGLYLTTDRAQSWKHVLPVNMCGVHDTREQIAFDKSSFDGAKGYSMVAYWSRFAKDNCAWTAEGLEEKGALYKSKDGGETWTEMPGTEMCAGGIVRVHPVKGYIYVGNANGIYKSPNGGVSFQLVFNKPVTGMDVIISQPDHIYVSTNDGLFISENAGEVFTQVESKNYPKARPAHLKVSPANPKHMFVQETSSGWWYVSKCYSLDGGITWGETRLESQNPAEKIYHYLPFNSRKGYAVWHPTDPNVYFTWSADWSSKSSDAGNSNQWNHNGLSAVMTGGFFNFSTTTPDVLAIATQDYDAHLTTNGGTTWKYLDISRLNWGGYIYGAYSPDGKLVIAGLAPSWSGPRKIAVTKDGGATVTHTGIGIGERYVAYGDPTDEKVLFIGNQRTDDGASTWKPMAGCDGVFTSNPSGKKELYGVMGKTIVCSFDRGITWKNITELDADIRDIAFDHKANKIYAACNSKLLVVNAESGEIDDITESVPADQLGKRTLNTIAVDPVNPNVVYVGGNSNTYSTDVAVARSLDGGKTWKPLTRAPRHNNEQFGIDGGREAVCIRVNPANRVLYVGTNCYGLWRFGPPQEN